METITIEKVIKFDNIIDSIESVQVNNDLRYELLDDNTHAKGTINLTGSVNTILGQKDFFEDVDVDVYAPFDKIIDGSNFKMSVKDYSYMVNQQNLIVYLVIDLDGIIDRQDIDVNNNDNNMTNENIVTENNENVVESINTLNEINDNNETTIKEEVEVRNVKEECNVTIKENTDNESINPSWATDLFKLSDNYTVFMKFHVE